MGSFTSTLYTIGTALSRAQDADVPVDLLVTGQWIHGHVSALDGHGVVLHGDGDELSIIRMGSIDAVKVAPGSDVRGTSRGGGSIRRDGPPDARRPGRPGGLIHPPHIGYVTAEAEGAVSTPT